MRNSSNSTKNRIDVASAQIAKLPREAQEIVGLKAAVEELKEGIQVFTYMPKADTSGRLLRSFYGITSDNHRS